MVERRKGLLIRPLFTGTCWKMSVHGLRVSANPLESYEKFGVYTEMCICLKKQWFRAFIRFSKGSLLMKVKAYWVGPVFSVFEVRSPAAETLWGVR